MRVKAGLSKPETEHSRDVVAGKIRKTNIDQDEISFPRNASSIPFLPLFAAST